MSATIRKNSWWAVLPVLVLLLSLTRASSAHNPMTSWAVARLYADRMELEVEMAAESAWAFLGESADVPPDVASKLPQLRARAGAAYRVFDGGAQLAARGAEVELKEEDGVGLVIVYPRPTAGPLRFEATYLSRLPAGHRTTLTLKDERDVVRRTELLTASNAAVEVPLPPGDADAEAPGAARPVSFWAFLKLGVEHILTGYDHLLFLLGLLVACRRFKSMALIVTCFTVAHSVTLALAALDLVNLPAGVVEPLIAASIVFVGVENLLRSEEPKWRWALTFGFGLIHGFGFAGVLKEIGLGTSTSSLLVALFSFNLGVELGQLAVTALVLPVLWKLRDVPAFARYGRVAVSAVVALAGAYWLVQRLFL
jgi:hydrogenase/urease accessory protein HupE